MKRFKLVVPSFIALIFCMLLIAGSTLALFTSKAEASISATSGKVDIDAELNSLQLLSADATISSSQYGLAGVIGDEEVEELAELDDYRGTYYFAAQEEHFANGGTATLSNDKGTLVLERMTPGDKVLLKLDSTNTSNVDIQVRLLVSVSHANDADDALLSSLVFRLGDKEYVGLKSYTSAWKKYSALAATDDFNLEIELPLLTGNGAQSENPELPRTVSFAFVLQAVQANAKTSGAEQIEMVQFNKVNYNDLNKEETVTAAQIQENVNNDVPTVVEAKDTATDLTVEASIPASLAATFATEDENTVELVVEKVGIIEDNTALTNKLEFDVSLLINDTPVSSTTEDVTVKMFIGKDLVISSVTHNDQPVTNYNYNPSTGYLTFATKSFSPFAIEYFKTFVEDNFIYYETPTELILVGAKDESLLVGQPLVIKNGVTKVAKEAFSGVKATSVTCPASLKEIGDYAFMSESGGNATGTITSVTFNEGLKKIGYRAFKAQAMTSVVLPSTIEMVDGAFWQCSNIESLTIPASLKYIDANSVYGAFGVTKNLSTLVIQEGVEVLGNRTFACEGGNTHLESVVLPKSLTTLGTYCFRDHYALSHVTILSETLSIASNAFMMSNNATGGRQEDLTVDVENMALFLQLSNQTLENFNPNKTLTSGNWYGFAASNSYKIHINYVGASAINSNDSSEIFQTVDELHAALVAGKSVKLLKDIDLANYEWAPVEDYAGTFDGNNKTISNLVISAPGDIGAMFYSVGNNATIKNVKFADVNIEGKYVAVVVGDAEKADNLTLTGIEVLSGTVNATGYAAGIAFDVEGSGVVMSNCKNNATITSDFSASGIGAWVYSNTGTFDHLENNGNVTAGNRAGGIFGNFLGTISNSINTGDVLSSGNMPAGGIVGVLGGASTFDHCVNTGDVKNSFASENANASAAGIFGHNPGSKAVVANYCINTGNITAEHGVAGGIGVAFYGNTTANYCYNNGNITGNFNSNSKCAAGGILPKSIFSGSATANYCLNAGTVSAESGTTTFVSIVASDSYYYEGAVLKIQSGTIVEVIQPEFELLNGGSDQEFWTIEDGYIIPAFLAE